MSKKPLNINCEEVIRELFSYLDGEVSPETRNAFDHHIEGCRSCFSRAEFERRLRQRINETVEPEVPDELRNRINQIIKNY